MNLRRVLAVAALAATSLAAGALALNRLFPPDLSRYHVPSSETVDANGRLLRTFTTADGKWRLKATVDDVDPVHLALAGAPPAGARRQIRPGRARSRAVARAGARHHRPGAVRQGGQPAGARSQARHAHAGAAPGGVARRPVPRGDRSHDPALRIA